MMMQGITALASALSSKKISSVELTRLFLTRIERDNPRIKAFISVRPEVSLAQAKAADARIAAGNVPDRTFSFMTAASVKYPSGVICRMRRFHHPF